MSRRNRREGGTGAAGNDEQRRGDQRRADRGREPPDAARCVRPHRQRLRNYGVSGFTIRGIANRGVSGGGDAPLLTIYVDGAPLLDQMVEFGPTDL